MTETLVKTSGYLSLYNGLSAAMLRQATYSTVRFAFYEMATNFMLNRANAELPDDKQIKKLPFYQMMIIAGAGGGIGSIFGKVHLMPTT